MMRAMKTKNQNGIQEVRGSTPLGSTTSSPRFTKQCRRYLLFTKPTNILVARDAHDDKRRRADPRVANDKLALQQRGDDRIEPSRFPAP